MKINEDIVLQIEKETKCPILEMFYTNEDKTWYVCFEEYTVIDGKNQVVHLNEVLERLKEFDNLEYIKNELYIDDENNYFEQITFQWKKICENLGGL